MIPDNKQDELIFDFLEGNLSADEEEAFLILKEENELLNRQVRLWQNTYLRAPLPSVEALEKKLLIPYRHGGTFPSQLYIILIVALVSIVFHGDWVQSYRVALPVEPGSKSSTTYIPPSRHEAETENSEIIATCPQDHYAKRGNEPVRQYEVKPNGKSLPELSTLTVADLERAVLLKPLLSPLTPVNITPSTSRRSDTVTKAKKWSRREVRLIRKKRRLDERTRKANEFLKGNEPYVVPLNGNNF
jgi:hypothetical protein